MDELKNSLIIIFASEFAYYLQSHRFHWNVEGANFKQYHDLFSDIYEEVHESIDEFAEHIRTLGAYVPASLETLSILSKVDDEIEPTDAMGMISKLHQDSQKMAKLYTMAIQLGEKNQQYGLVDFLTDRLNAHNKHAWMLRSTMR